MFLLINFIALNARLNLIQKHLRDELIARVAINTVMLPLSHGYDRLLFGCIIVVVDVSDPVVPIKTEKSRSTLRVSCLFWIETEIQKNIYLFIYFLALSIIFSRFKVKFRIVAT